MEGDVGGIGFRVEEIIGVGSWGEWRGWSGS